MLENQMKNFILTPGVEIKRLTPRDRRIFLNKNPLAAVILRCQPLGMAILQNQRKKYCNFCLAEKDLLRCQQCLTYYYCSKDCQIQDWKQLHKLECKLLSTLNNQTGQVPCNILLLIRLHKNKIQLEDFFGDLDKLQESQRKQFNETAIMIVAKESKLENSSIDNEKNLDAIGNLMILQTKIQMNAFTIVETINGIELGIGIYEPANFFDHRCSFVPEMGSLNQDCANCSVAFQGRELFVFTNDIFKEQIKNQKLPIELNISYNNSENRSQYLQDYYGFICTCSRCVYEKQIHNPGQILQLQASQTSKIEINDLQAVAQKFIKTQTIISFDELSQHIECFNDEKFYKPIESIYLIILNQKKYKQAFRILKSLIDGMPIWLTCQSHPYIGWKLNEASKLAFHLNFLIEAEEFSKEAINQIKMFYRDVDNIKDFQDLIRRLNDIQQEIQMSKQKVIQKF